MTLARLIETVEAGSRGDDFWSAVHVLPAMHITDVTLARDGSLDAAKRLHDALLPGWYVEDVCEAKDPTDCPGKHWLVQLGKRDESGDWAEGSADNEARARLLAILRAMEGRDG